MKKILLPLLIVGHLISFAQENTVLAPEIIAQELSNHFKERDTEALQTYFNAALQENLGSDQLKGFLQSITTNYGELENALAFSEKKIAEGTYYHQGLKFEKQSFDLIFSLDEENKLSSFRLAGHSNKTAWIAPEYVNQDAFSTEKIKIGENEPLLGEYTKAKSEETVIVVMVHGSGPNNMNERLGPNELFKDLAYGLASKGISSIRYNKRVYDYPSSQRKVANTITIDEEVVNDAVMAIQKAKAFGATKVILLGHSLGGHMAPKIANQVEVDGVIIMAGNASPLEDLIIHQYEHIMKNDSSSGITDFYFNMIKQQVNTLKERKYDASTGGMTLPFGMSGQYWMSMQDYDPTKIAKKQKFPYLILNGERDYQVTVEEAKKWKNGSKNSLSKTIIYPKLNHMFFAGEGICIPSEYENIGHINSVVLDDIIEWIDQL